MAKVKGITQAVIKTALDLVAGKDFNDKKKESRKYLPWIMNGSNYTALAFHPDVFDINGDAYAPCNESKPWSPSDDMGEMIGKVMVDNLRADIMAAIGKVVDMRECGCAYGRRLEDSKHVMRLGDSYFKLTVLDELQRILLLGGLEIAEVYENKKKDRVTFVGYHNGEPAVLAPMMALHDYNEVNDKMPLIGRLTLMQLDAEAEIVPELILESITNIKTFWAQEAHDAKRFRKIYAVQVATYNTYCVLAMSHKEAENIALDIADLDDFNDPDFEVENCEESCIEEAEDNNNLYDEDGEVDIDEYKEDMGYYDEEEE